LVKIFGFLVTILEIEKMDFGFWLNFFLFWNEWFLEIEKKNGFWFKIF